MAVGWKSLECHGIHEIASCFLSTEWIFLTANVTSSLKTAFDLSWYISYVSSAKNGLPNSGPNLEN